MTISETTLALLKFSKSETNDYTWKNIRDNCLGELYHYDMQFHDVFHIVLESVNEIMNEPRFENHFGKDILNVLIYKEIKGKLFDKPITEITGEEMMQRILNAIMFDAFRFSRVDWCEEFKNYPNRYETKVNKKFICFWGPGYTSVGNEIINMKEESFFHEDRGYDLFDIDYIKGLDIGESYISNLHSENDHIVIRVI